MSVPPNRRDETYYSKVAPPRAGLGDRLRDLLQDKSRLQRIGMIGGVIVVAVVSAAFWLSGGRYSGTDNAYIRAAKLMVTTDVSGIVKTVDVRQGQFVHKGDILFTLDPQAFEIAVDNDQAAVDQTALDLNALKATYQSEVGSINAQQATVRLNEITYKRYLALAKSNAISAQQMDDARQSLRGAQATLVTQQQAAQTNLAKLKGNPNLPLEKYPAYTQAKATLAEAKRQLSHTVVRAPFDGVVGEVDSLQPGTLVVSSLSSFTTTSSVGMVSSTDLWVSADMKETDLTYVHEGNDVEFTVDTYPGHVWHGTVEAISRASDSAFSVLPAENSSANWVKVVQRIPVRIKINTRPGDPPLRAGMSVLVSIDTGHRRWWRMIYGD
ncbi:MAG: HlyD family secretion protein [Rhizomicrobium sp.]